MRRFYNAHFLNRHRWIPTSMAAGLALALAAPCALAECQANGNCWPPVVGCPYIAYSSVSFPGTQGPAAIRKVEMHDPTQCETMPLEHGNPAYGQFDIVVDLQVTLDGGLNWSTVQNLGLCNALIHPPACFRLDGIPPICEFDIELLQFDIAGGDLPPGTMIRESPTQVSTVQTEQQLVGDGLYMWASSFKVLIELSLDGGQSWHPGDTSLDLRSALPTPTLTRSGTWGSVKVLYR